MALLLEIMIEEELIDFGLTSNEAKIYLVLLENGALNPYQIAEKTGLHRGYIYDALERMQKKGVVSAVHKLKKKHYQAAQPKALAAMLQEKASHFQKVVPQLNILQEKTTEDMRVEVYKGKSIFRICMNDQISTMHTKRDLLMISSDEKTYEETDPIYIQRYLQKEQETGCKEKVIIKKGGYQLKAKHIEYRELPLKMIGNASLFVYANRVSFLLWGNPNNLIIIKNQEVADTYTRQFNVLWGLAKKTK